jgi:purine-cytosine permease-like protein
MNLIKRIAGVLWIVAGPFAIYYLATTAISEINKNPIVSTKVQWIVFVGVFIPIAIGMIIFGYYALKGEYDDNVKI